MLDDEMQYEKSKDSRAGMCDDYERDKNHERKMLEAYIRKLEVKSTRKWMIKQS